MDNKWDKYIGWAIALIKALFSRSSAKDMQAGADKQTLATNKAAEEVRQRMDEAAAKPKGRDIALDAAKKGEF